MLTLSFPIHSYYVEGELIREDIVEEQAGVARK